MAHVAADFALKAQGLFFGGFAEFPLERVFLSTVAFFFAFVVAFTFREGSAFSSLVEADGVSSVSFTFWAVSCDFFGNIHVCRFPAFH